MAGLLHMDRTGQISVLATDHAGQPLRFVDDLDVDEQGGIWFSDASERFDYMQVALDFFEGSRTGSACVQRCEMQACSVLAERTPCPRCRDSSRRSGKPVTKGIA